MSKTTTTAIDAPSPRPACTHTDAYAASMAREVEYRRGEYAAVGRNDHAEAAKMHAGRRRALDAAVRAIEACDCPAGVQS